MRKITQDAFNAFIEGRPFRKTGNGATEVVIDEDGTRRLRLHGNTIAEYDPADRGVYITDAGWGSVTTRERLKPFATVSQSKWVQHLTVYDDETGEWAGFGPWDGSLTFVGVIKPGVDNWRGPRFVQVSEADLTPVERAQARADRIKANLDAQGEDYDEATHAAYAEALEAVGRAA
jgi:hypothetical protein